MDEQAAVAAPKKTRVPTKYVVIARNNAGDLIWAAKDTRKEVKEALNDVIAAGGTIESLFRGARAVETKTKTVVTI